MVTEIDDSTRDMLQAAIAQGVESGIIMDELIERIAKDYAFSDDRARLIAETEVGTANGHGSVEGMRAARDAGVQLKKLWVCDPAPCEDCQENGDVGAIDLDDDFPSGDDAPYAHPNCRCVVISVTEGDENDEVEN